MLLNTHTYYSLNYGVLSIEDYLSLLQRYGYEQVALTDINNTSACLEFIRLASNYGIKPVVGIDFRNGAKQKFVGIAQNNEGFQELNAFLSKHLHAGIDFPDEAPEFINTQIIYPFASYQGWRLKDNEWVGISPQDLSKLRFSKKRIPPKKMVAQPICSFVKKDHYMAHRLLRAINQNVLISRLEENNCGSVTNVFPTKLQLKEKYKECPEALENSANILSNSSIQFVFKDAMHHENKKTLTGDERKDYDLLLKLCEEGLTYRYKIITPEIKQRLNKEIDIITKKGFVGYFLMNWKIIQYARYKDYYYVGRGSGANSIVAYLLRITDVDPIELDLYFERFINLYRQNPPDFDIDFSWRDRDDMTRFIFEEFPSAALLGTYNTLKKRAVLRELSKVFGLPKHEQDKLTREQIQYDLLDRTTKSVLSCAILIDEFPDHLSIHASGIVIPERSINYFGGTFMPPKGYQTTQFSMIEAEDVGLYKFDILSQRGLGKIKDCLEIIHDNQPDNPPEDIRNISKFKADSKVNNLLKKGEAIGCFYVESPAMRMLLSKLSVDNYLGLVAASSIIRPGVASSGMMREYILRHHGESGTQETPKEMMDLMPDTYGVMVYQEDVIKVAHHLADLTLGEADELRRGMSGKYRTRVDFEEVKNKFISNCLRKGYTRKLTNEIWNQIESFAGYAFSKGHSASYAVESYQCLYLKAYYPLEYMVATLNNYGGFYRREVYIHEARMLGAEVESPCINKSEFNTIIKGKSIVLGFDFIKGLEIETIRYINENRIVNGAFVSFEDFVSRVNIAHEQTALLVRANVFRSVGSSKQELLWKAYFAGNKKVKSKNYKLFSPTIKAVDVPELEYDSKDEVFDQMELLGFPLSNPFEMTTKKTKSNLKAKEFSKYLGQVIEIRGYLVAIKNTGTSKGQKMNFGTFLDEDGRFFDTTHFPDSAKHFPFRGRGVYVVKGKVVEEFDFYSLEVTEQYKEAFDYPE